jgi:hypothetical protein
LEAAWGRDPLVAALSRARQFRRFKAADVRSILEAGIGIPTITAPGEVLDLDLPAVPVRGLDDYRLEVLA